MLTFIQLGRTPLHEATSMKSNDEIVNTLINAGANVNVVDEVSYWRASQCNNY